MNSNQIKFFLDIIQTGGFTKAAEKNFVAQSTVSTQIAALEEELGVKLLSRSRNHVRLTPAGKDFAEYFHRINIGIGELCEKYAGISDTYTRISVSIQIGLGEKVLTAAIDDFKEMHFGNAEVLIASLEPGQLHEELEAGSHDLWITTNSMLTRKNTDVEYEVLAPCHTYLAVPRDHEKLRNADCSVHDFMDEVLLVPPVYSYYTLANTHLIGILRMYKLGNNGYRTVDDMQTIGMLIRSGAGVALFDAPSEASLLDCGFGAIDIGKSVSMVAAWKKGNSNPVLSAFVDSLKSGWQ